MTVEFNLLLCVAYLLGSVSFAVLLARLRHQPDPRHFGSGNPGASNMLRLGNRPLALATLLGDMGKGALAVWLASQAGLEPVQLAWVGLAAVAGHILPLYHRFHGGKGVATAAGVLLVLAWPAAAVAALAWLSAFAIRSIASLASLVACVVLLPWLAWHSPELQLPVSLMVLMILLRHRLNIGRLLAGNENRFRH
ncbi:acyl-phosphate glycerol-3-phosphate acyltransferase [Halopseudomonas litoralis]|uniref:Glycerol-3-phosphate acyltransferase n=1 Tax=Halopseudomonas litoralis TaxID=797277 RepID=A0A1H1V6N5_9GAMM|nr:glycerol-3-phosphate 1-O-acyltransferase PlsY [Halopseudomonas litoralis]SDS80280.1 acyl-phosphate glycerol-3-phosphate acyltransferase [Halopseudomonas litoralis]